MLPILTRLVLDVLGYIPQDDDVRAWRDAINAAGGSVSASTLRAADRLVIGLKTALLWDKCYMIDLCAGNTLTAALVRLKVPAGVARAYANVNFVSAAYTEATGLTGNGTNAYLDTLINPVALGYSLTSFGISNYVLQTAAAGTSQISLGNSDVAAINATFQGWAISGSRESGAVGAATTTTGTIPAGSGATTGLLTIVCNGDRNQNFYANGVAVNAPVLAAGAFSNRNMFKMAFNQNGTASSYVTRRHGSSFIHAGLSAIECATLYNLDQAFETAIQRAP